MGLGGCGGVEYGGNHLGGVCVCLWVTEWFREVETAV